MDTPQDIFIWAKDYLQIISAGVPFLAVYNLYAALPQAEFHGQENN